MLMANLHSRQILSKALFYAIMNFTIYKKFNHLLHINWMILNIGSASVMIQGMRVSNVTSF